VTTIKGLILKEWFKFFLGAFLVLILLISVAELISGFLRSNVTPIEVIFNHILELPEKLKLILPVSCLAASLFSINKLKNRNELTAIFAAGYSRKKFVLDILTAALVIGFLQLIISSYIDPFSRSKMDHLIKDGEAKFKNLKSKGLMASTIGSGKMWFKSSEYFFSFSKFDVTTDTLSDATIYYYRNSKLHKKIIAEFLIFVNNGWSGQNVQVLEFLDGQNFPHLRESGSLQIDIVETPSDFKEIESDITTLNTYELFKYINTLQEGGINVNEYLVMFYDKFSPSLVCIIFSLLAAIGGFKPNRRGSSFGKNIFFVFIFVIIYWLVNSYFIELGKSSKIDPAVACFAVPLIFSLFLIFQFVRNRKLI